MLALAGVLALIAVVHVAAQPAEIRFAPPHSIAQGTTNSETSLRAGLLDDDALLDIVYSPTNLEAVWVKNRGGGNWSAPMPLFAPSPSPIIPAPAGKISFLELADIDADGATDVVLGALLIDFNDNFVAWYRNANASLVLFNSSEPMPVASFADIGGGQGVRAIAVGDVTGDGLLDIVFVTSQPNVGVFWAENAAPPNNVTGQFVFRGAYSPSALAINHNPNQFSFSLAPLSGAPEFAGPRGVGIFIGTAAVLMPGPGQPTVELQLFGAIEALCFGAFAGQSTGSPWDVAILVRVPSTSDTELVVLLNRNNASSISPMFDSAGPMPLTRTGLFEPGAQMQAVDLDADQLLDVLVCGASGTLGWYRQNRSISAAPPLLRVPEFAEFVTFLNSSVLGIGVGGLFLVAPFAGSSNYDLLVLRRLAPTHLYYLASQACPSLLPPANGAVSSTAISTFPGTERTYSCNFGYVNASASLGPRVCLPTNQWSGAAPTCVPVPACRIPLASANISLANDTSVTAGTTVLLSVSFAPNVWCAETSMLVIDTSTRLPPAGLTVVQALNFNRPPPLNTSMVIKLSMHVPNLAGAWRLLLGAYSTGNGNVLDVPLNLLVAPAAVRVANSSFVDVLASYGVQADAQMKLITRDQFGNVGARPLAGNVTVELAQGESFFRGEVSAQQTVDGYVIGFRPIVLGLMTLNVYLGLAQPAGPPLAMPPKFFNSIVLCPPGTRVNPAAAASAQYCLVCEPNTFSSVTTDIIAPCTPCPANSITNRSSSNNGARSIGECECAPDAFADARAGDTRACSLCPPHASCAGGDARPLANAGFSPVDASNTQFEPCPRPAGACLAGSRCGQGYTGFLCASCQPGWRSNAVSGACERCASSSRGLLALYWVLLAVLAIATLVLTACNQGTANAHRDEAMSSSQLRRSVVPASVSQAVAALQLVALLARLPRSSLPSTARSAVAALAIVNLDVTLFLSECNVRSFGASYLLPLASPPIYFAMLALFVALWRLCRLTVPLCADMPELSLVAVFKTGLLSIGPLAYLSVSSTVLVLFACQKLPGTSQYVLRADVGVRCFDAAWWRLAGVGIVAGLVYLVLYPVALTVPLLVYRARLFTDASLIATYGSLFRIARRRYVFLKIVLLARRLAVVAAVLFLAGAPALLLFVLLLLLGGVGVAQALAAPYYHPLFNAMDRAYSAILALLILGALAFLADAGAHAAVASIVTTISVLCVAAALATSAAAVVWEVRDMRRSDKSLASPAYERRAQSLVRALLLDVDEPRAFMHACLAAEPRGEAGAGAVPLDSLASL